MEMVERFLLDRVDIFSDSLTVNQAKEFAFAVFPHTATPPATSGNDAVKAAEVTADSALVKRFPKFCGMEIHRGIITEQIAVSCKPSALRQTLQPYSL